MALEEYIEGHDPTNENNIVDARSSLQEANTLLTNIAQGNSRVIQHSESSLFEYKSVKLKI